MYGFTPFATQNPTLSGLGDVEPIPGVDYIPVGYRSISKDLANRELMSLWPTEGAVAGFDITKPPTWLLVAGGALLGLALLRKR